MDTDSAATLPTKIARSRAFFAIIIGAAPALLLLIVFEAGMAVGFHRAAFSYHLDQDYARRFGPVDDAFGPASSTPNSHGSIGTVVSATADTITVANTRGPEETVHVGSDTLIRKQSGAASSSALTAGTSVIIIGEPEENGEIDARLIRIVPTTVRATTTAP